MSRFALNDLSHQKNMNLQTPISHHKLCNSAQQSKHQQMTNQSMPLSNLISEKTSFKGSQNQFMQQQQSQQQQMSQQLYSQQSQQSSNQNNSSSKETPFFTNSIKNTVSINMFGQSQLGQIGKENIFSASQALQQTDPPEQKFGGSYQIFESMIEEGIKDIQQLFNQNDVANKEQQRRGAFGGYMDMQSLEQAILEGQASDFEIYVDKQQNNFLSIPVPDDLFDEESVIKKSLSALNEDYLHLNQFQFQNTNDDNDPALGFFDESGEGSPTNQFEDKILFY